MLLLVGGFFASPPSPPHAPLLFQSDLLPFHRPRRNIEKLAVKPGRTVGMRRPRRRQIQSTSSQQSIVLLGRLVGDISNDSAQPFVQRIGVISGMPDLMIRNAPKLLRCRDNAGLRRLYATGDMHR